MYGLDLCQLDMLVLLEGESLTEEMSPQIGLWATLWYIFLTDICCGRTQLTVGGTTTGQMVLSAIKKTAEQARRRKLAGSTPQWTLPQPLPPGFCPDFSQ